jgi:glutathione S-transferase
MAYTLYGSQTSPYVRKLRILLHDIQYDFKEMAIFEKEDAEKLNKINPINQVPVLTDGDLTIWDSRQIFNYLNAIHRFQNLTWDDENLLTAIDGMIGSAINLVLLKKSGLDITEDKMFFNRQRDRIKSIESYLENYLTGKGLTEWNYHSISLYCYFDWAIYRGVIKADEHPIALKFLNAHKDRESVKATFIPEGR